MARAIADARVRRTDGCASKTMKQAIDPIKDTHGFSL